MDRQRHPSQTVGITVPQLSPEKPNSTQQPSEGMLGAAGEGSSGPNVTREELQARRDAKKKHKASKRAARETQRLLNALQFDERAHVRIAASQAIHGEEAKHPSSGPATQDATEEDRSDGARAVSLSGLQLETFSISLLGLKPAPLTRLASLNLSHNQLTALPGIEQLVGLTELDLCKNELRSLPRSLRELPRLSKLNVSRNQLRPNAEFLVLLLQPPGLPALEELDLRFNKKIFTQQLADLLRDELPSVTTRLTVTSPPPTGAYVGDAACDRDPQLLRSQLEPFTTLQLRRRLVETFGHEQHSMHGAPPEPRAEVMKQLLDCYAAVGIQNARKVVSREGKAVDPVLLSQLHSELRAWSGRYERHQERPTIHAEKYMILRSPAEFEQKLNQGSAKAHAASLKYRQNAKLWQLAACALATVDEAFAAKFTGLAVTQGFRGSPHIDTTNIG